MEREFEDQVREDVRRALMEDVGSGDLTASLIPENARSQATVISREAAVLCGVAWFDEVFRALDPDVDIRWYVQDGGSVRPDQPLCDLEGKARALLSGERTALNFLQILSGTATTARRYADAVAGTQAQVLDTRKTLPGLRLAQKYAVACGGCRNHRKGLYDAILIKENHILAAGSIGRAVAAARRQHPGVTVEVEVESLEELQQGLEAEADILLLDNFDTDRMAEAVALTAGRAKLEASGGITLGTIRKIAETGVDFISVGALTKDVHAVDLSMRFAEISR